MDKRERLDQIGREWCALPSEGCDAVRVKLQEEIFSLAMKVFPNKADAMGLFFLNDWRSFNADVGTLSNFLAARLKHRMKDLERQDFDGQRKTEISDRTDKKISVKKRHKSLDAPPSTDEETEQTLGDTLPAKTGEAEGVLLAEVVFVELTSMVLNFSKNHTGRQANETRRMWYQIFFTEDVTHVYKTQPYAFSHERDIFCAMLLPYLDYYMAAQCRAGKQVSFTPLKPYGEVVPDRRGDTGETPVPLPADVSLAWLRREGIQAGASARSNQRRSYEAEKREKRRS